MKKKLALLLGLVMVTTMVAGCKSNLPEKGTETPNTTEEGTTTEEPAAETPDETGTEEPAVTAEGALKTGLGVITSTGSSKDAAEEDGLAQIDSTVVAVTLDADGKIVNCVIDAAQTKVNFSKEGTITTDIATSFPTKNELGEGYGMKPASGIGKEWNEQATAFADYVIGKTVDEVKGIAIDDHTSPTDADLAASVTIGVKGLIDGIEKAAANAQDAGAQAGDKLGLGVETNIAKSKNVEDGKDGQAQAYSTYTAVTTGADGKITSCVIDSTQGNVNFNAEGKITSDLSAPVQTKNELGDAYGMKAASGIGKEWNEQAAAFANYVVGKTADEVNGIALDDHTSPTDADLAASVTIGVAGYIGVITKAIASAK